MDAFQTRVLCEKSELDERRGKLFTFLRTELFLLLPLEEQHRLIRQLYIMDEYSRVLGERIENFP